MSDAAPVIRLAGVMVMPDWYVPTWPEMIVLALAALWILFGAAWVFLGARRGGATRPAIGYAIGAVLATIAILATVWGPPTWDHPIHRLEVLVQYLGSQLLLVACGLGSMAATLGWLTRRIGHPPGPDKKASRTSP